MAEDKTATSEKIQTLAHRFGRPAAVCLLFAWLAYVVTAGQPNFELHVFPATLTLQILYAIVFLVYGAQLALRRRLPGPTLLDWPVAALALVYCFAIAGSIYPRVSLEAALLIAAVLLTFYAFHDFAFLSVEVMIRGLVAVGAIAAGFAVYHVGEDYVKWLQLVDAVDGRVAFRDLLPPAVPRVRGVGDHVNILAMALNLALPFALSLSLRPTFRFERFLAAGATLLILAAIFFTLSRGAWLGTLAALPLFGALYLLRDRDLASLVAPLRRSPFLAGGIAVACLLSVLIGAGLVAGRWDSRPAWLFRASVSPRLDAFDVGLEIFRDRPLLGSGPYTYPLLYNVYSGKYPIENIHPHNGYLNVLVDAGVFGGVALLAGGVVLSLAMLRSYRTANSHSRVLLAACFASLTTLAVHSLGDSPNGWSTALLPFALVLAITLRLCERPSDGSLAPGPEDDRQTRPVPASWLLVGRFVPRLAVLLLFPSLLLGWTAIDVPHRDFDRSVGLLSEGRFREASARATKAADKDGASAAYEFNAGVTQAIVFLVSEGRGEQPPQSLLESAIGHIERGISSEPRGAVGYANLALALKLKADRTLPGPPAGVQSAAPGTPSYELKERAVEAAKTALLRGPTDGATATAAGSVLEWAARYDEARFAYGLALRRDPALAQSPFWAANRTRLDLRLGAMYSSLITPCQQGRVTAIYRGYADDLEELASDCADLVRGSPGDVRARAGLAIILHALGREREARTHADEAVRRIPDDPFARTALGIVRAGEGNLSAGRHQLMLGAYLGDPDAALLLAYTYEPPRTANPVIDNLRLPVERGPLPQPVRDRLSATLSTAAPFFYDEGKQNYLLGILYYRVRFMRESPTSILIPGEWLELASPRALLILDAVQREEAP